MKNYINITKRIRLFQTLCDEASKNSSYYWAKQLPESAVVNWNMIENIFVYPTPLSNTRICNHKAIESLHKNKYISKDSKIAIIGIKHKLHIYDNIKINIRGKKPGRDYKKNIFSPIKQTTNMKTTHFCLFCIKNRFPGLYNELLKICLDISKTNPELLQVITYQQLMRSYE